MSKTEITSRRTAIILLAAAIGLVLLVGIGLLLRDNAPGNMGNGFLFGAGIAVFASLIIGWRVANAPSGATSFERAGTSQGDEHDDVVLTRALAVLGLMSLPLTSAAAFAIALGADVPMVLLLLLTAEVLTGVLAFVITARRH